MKTERTYIEFELRAKLANAMKEASFNSEDEVPIIDLETALKIIRGANE